MRYWENSSKLNNVENKWFSRSDTFWGKYQNFSESYITYLNTFLACCLGDILSNLFQERKTKFSAKYLDNLTKDFTAL